MKAFAQAFTPDHIVKLVAKREQLLRDSKKADEELAAALHQLPLGAMFQDPVDSVVYQVVTPTGTFVSFKSIDYVRTKRSDEQKGSLSMKAALEVGFVVKGGE